MTAAELLTKLRGVGIEVRADGDALRVNAPKGVMTAELAKAIRDHKPQLLEFLAGATGAAGLTSAPITPRSEDGPAPMSFAQQRLWYLDQLDPGTAVYNVPVAFWLRGALSADILGRALREIVRRHDVLRSRFRLTDDGPRVELAEAGAVALATVDLSTIADPNQQDEELRTRLREEARRPFDLANGPLVRALFARTASDAGVLLFTTHHVASDGWSQAVFESELVEIYDQLHRGRAPQLPPLPVQYGDYATWQHAHLSGPVLETQLAYWKERLSGALPVLSMPTDAPRPSMQPSSGRVASLTLSSAVLGPLASLARAEGATLFNAMLAAYVALLARYTGQTDIIIGSPVAGRVRPELEGLIGCFTNTLALRIDLSGAPSFRQLLGRVASVVRGAIEHQDVPFERLVEELDPERDLSRTPIFQTIFAFEDAGALPEVPASSAIRVAHRETVHADVSRTDLSVWCSSVGNELRVTVEYCDELFAAETARELLEHFARLLGNVAAAPDTPVGELPLLAADATHALLGLVNATDLELPDAPGFHSLFEATVAAHPDRVAAISGDEELSYRELDQRAQRLAARLGPGRGSLVGVAVARSLDMLVAVLAVGKSGAGYLPLDPTYPRDRLAYMIEDAGLERIVADTTSAAALAPIAPRVEILQVRDTENAGGAALVPVATEPDDIAYVIYTSGSTGKPKGVEVPHRAVTNFLTTMAERPGLNGSDVLLAVTTLSFDIAVLELYLPLTVGARVVIADADQAADGGALLDLLERHQVTAMQATPSTWRLLLGAGWNGPHPAKVLCGGEAFPGDLLAPLCERAEVWNMYGPTETTVWSTCAQLNVDDPIHIGRPIGNTRVYVLDAHGQLVPPMVRGELFIGGTGVTLGYRGRPELTAARFKSDPFVPGGRIYATGDQAWWDREGRLFCGGRIDGQVKVRGYRIELGEIETVMSTHPAVAACAAMVREDRPGDVRLVGYVVAAPGKQPTVTELRAHLRSQLPDYMVVQHLVELEELPLTPAGKIDRAALPAPDAVQRASGDYVAPRTPTEEYVARLWAEALGVDRVGLHDNFFDRGGHSLLSMQVIVRIDRDTGARLSPRALLLDSLEQIAAQIPTAP